MSQQVSGNSYRSYYNIYDRYDRKRYVLQPVYFDQTPNEFGVVGPDQNFAKAFGGIPVYTIEPNLVHKGIFTTELTKTVVGQTQMLLTGGIKLIK